MIENFKDLFLILFQTTLIFVVLFMIYRKQIFSFFDPLLFYILTQAFSIELGILQISDVGYLASFLFCQLFFALGFSYVAKRIRNKSIIDDSNLSFNKNEYKFWVYFAVVSFVIVVIANLYLISIQGVILFSDDPTTTKVAAFEGGGGIGAVRRINWGLLNLVNLVVIFIYVKTKNRFFLAMLLILVLIAISGGAKSSLLVYIILLAFLGQFKSINKTSTFKTIEKIKIPLFVSGIALSIFIIGSNMDSIGDSVLGLGIRFLYFGDILFYYYNDYAVTHFQQLGFTDFLKYELNPFLGILRIVPYMEPLSFEMVKYSFMKGEVLNVVTGPNLPYYVKGHVFFGRFGSLIYSFLVGCFIALLRNQLFKKHYSYTKYLLVIFINMKIFSFAQDSTLTMSILFDTIVFSIVPILIALILIYSPYKIIK